MQSIYELVTFKSYNEHDLEHDLEQSQKFSEPKIYDANGDLSKRWYLYFSYRNPETGKLERMKNIYGKVNRYKTKTERYSVLNIYKKRLKKFLVAGYNPFEDNTVLHNKRLKVSHENMAVNVNNTNIDNEDVETPILQSKTIEEAFEFALNLKSNLVGKQTLIDYKSRCNRFITWLNSEYSIKYIQQLNKKLVTTFLNKIQQDTSARNRNNYRTCFSSLFQTLEDNEVISKNFIKQIKPLKSKPKRNKTYSIKEQQEIFKYLKENDTLLLLYIKFISYNLLRPIEVCRLKIKDINFEQKTLEFQAKNKVLKTKIIPDILFQEIKSLKGKTGDFLIFTPSGIGGFWDTELVNRRDFFSKRFKTVIKDHFGYDNNYGLYSFRHTFITKLYRALVENSSPFEAKSKLMQITGHSTMTALEQYLRDIDAELPKDYSKLL